MPANKLIHSEWLKGHNLTIAKEFSGFIIKNLNKLNSLSLYVKNRARLGKPIELFEGSFLINPNWP